MKRECEKGGCVRVKRECDKGGCVRIKRGSVRRVFEGEEGV